MTRTPTGHLEIETAAGTTRVDLDKPKVTIGRHGDNTLTLDDQRVSRFHCEIARTRKGFMLRDLDSRNGTQMNGSGVQTVLLRPDDEFTVGDTKVRFVEDTAAHSPDRRAPESRLDNRESTAAEDDPAAAASIELEPGSADPGDSRPVVRAADYGIGSIEALVNVGRNVPFGPSEVGLINGRGQVVHAAAGGSATGRQSTIESLRMLRLLLLGCIRASASDIHVEPKRTGGLVRLRIDGAMVEVAELGADSMKRLLNLVKVICEIDFTKKVAVQEGHCSAEVPGRRIDYRISFTPSMFGQKLVVRVLDPDNAPQRLRDLGMPLWMYNAIRNMAQKDTGMLLVAGPTGSGKTTTLYTVLRQIDAKMRNVITIEDPVEYEVAGVTQIPVDEGQGHSFDSLLRSVLRQDPDVIVLGEVRDRDTATTAMHAATTGHLVLSTIHAKDSINTIFRLLDLGVEPYLVASTLNLILGQRLTRSLCPHCKDARKPRPTQIIKLGRPIEGINRIYTPAGCPKCYGTGYLGRQGLFELLTTTEELRDIILKSPNIAAIRKAIDVTMFTSLRDNGVEMILKGDTSMAEIDRVIGMD